MDNSTQHNLINNTVDTQKTICDLLQGQAKLQPKQIAIIDGNKQITFEQFTTKANAVANSLNERDISPGSLVGVCMERTWELIATLLGVMQARCAYMPIDPNYPEHRIGYMLAHSRAAAVVIDNENSARLCASVKQQLDINQISNQPTTYTYRPSAHDLAYVIYTSGSTGNPKGVAVEHTNLLSFVNTLDSLLNKEELSGMLATSSVCFDSSITETLATMSLGGTVILAQDGLALTEPSLEGKIKSCVMIPSVLQTILSGNELPQSLRCLLVGGEALKKPLAQQLHQLKPDLRLINVYGPTEDTVFSTTKEITADVEKITIGNSVPGSRAYILDDSLKSVDVGVAGELHLSGEKLARGYLYDEERTRGLVPIPSKLTLRLIFNQIEIATP